VDIAIKASDRSPRRNYLAQTILNLRRAGATESVHSRNLSVVLSQPYGWTHEFVRREIIGAQHPDGSSGDTFFGFIKAGNRTLHQNAAAAIRQASKYDAEWAMVLEDDLDFSDGFLESVVAWLGDVERPEFPMYVLGANYAQIDAPGSRTRGFWQYPVGLFYGAQALVWRRDVARELAEWLGDDPFFVAREEEVKLGHAPRPGIKVRDHGHDLLLQKWARERGTEFFCASSPCMVQHVGEESGIGNRFFQFPWDGRQWRYNRRVER
jgi:hypothetical protein